MTTGTRDVFGDPGFTPITILSRHEDHVVARNGGKTIDYAIGHLPKHVQADLAPPATVGAAIAKAERRTVLGILFNHAIDDLHNTKPTTCPMTLNFIRRLSPDPDGVLEGHARSALRLGTVSGKETGRNGERILYASSQGHLQCHVEIDGLVLDYNRLLMSERIPMTIALAARGRRVDAVIDHPLVRGVDAVVADIGEDGTGTAITFTTRPVATPDKGDGHGEA